MRGGVEEGRGKRGEPGAAVRRPKDTKGTGDQVTKMAVLYRKEQPSPLNWRDQGRGGVYQPGGPC